MRPFRKNVAIAIDGGGIRGVIVAHALAILENHLGQPLNRVVRLAAGTSTGSIIAAGIAAGIPAKQIYALYVRMGSLIFRKTLRTRLFPITRHKYESTALQGALRVHLGDRTLGQLWQGDQPFDLVITTFDLVDNQTRFLKPWKKEYASWPVVKAVLASSAVPTFFPVVDGRYVDGGVGSYANPSYLAAYEAKYCLNWDPAETTLISLGTGRSPQAFDAKKSAQLRPWQWLEPMFGAFMRSADDQQIHLVDTFFSQLDFRRFQVDLPSPIRMDDVTKIPRLAVYGEELGRKILSDHVDPVQHAVPPRVFMPSPAQTAPIGSAASSELTAQPIQEPEPLPFP